MSKPPPLLDALEPRRLFASVTLIAHGYAPNEYAPGWQADMVKAIARREGGADVYRLTIRGRDEDAFVSSFKLASANAAGSPSGDIVVLLDWAKSSDIFGETTPADRIAELVRPYFLQPLPNTSSGHTRPLGELPIHLIGHSRGGPVVTEIAKDLGQQGMWVDHVTTLDARPVDEPDPEAWENITFFDNYYQQVTLNGVLNGFPVEGARNINLSPVFDFAVLDAAHSDVWAYYAGTVNTNLSSFNGNDIDSDWYDDDEETGPRSRIGYAWSRAVGVPRPNRGNRFRTDGEEAHRENLNLRTDGPDVWDNVTLTTQLAPTAVDIGAGVPVKVQVSDENDDATFTLFLDTDDNPYNGALIPTGTSITGDALNAAVWSPTLVTEGLTPGTYHIVAQATNPKHTRYDYSVGTLTLLPPGTGGSGTVITFSAISKTSYLDAAGNKVTPKLTGPGSGLIVLTGAGTNPKLISLAGTSERSRFTLSSSKPTVVDKLTVSGSLGTLSATRLSVQSGLTSGAITTLSLASLTGTSAISGPIGSATVPQLFNTTLAIAGSVDKFATTTVTGSNLLIGFSPTTDPANPQATDIATPSATLGSFTVKGTFAGSTLAAPLISSARFGQVAVAAPSLVAARSIGFLGVSTPRYSDKPVTTSGTAVPGLKVLLIS